MALTVIPAVAGSFKFKNDILQVSLNAKNPGNLSSGLVSG